jgi:PAS domain S-box-containing protein
MRFNTLQFRVSALVFVFGLLMIGLSILRQYHHDVKMRIEQMRLQAYREGTRLSSLAQHFFRRHLPLSADLAISYAAVDPDLRLGVITDGRDIVRYSTQQQWRGVSLWECPITISPHLVERIKKEPEGLLNENAEGSRLTAIFPFVDMSGEMTSGLVVLEYNLSDFTAEAATHAINETMAQASMLFGSCLVFWTLLQILVTERVSLIVEQTRRIGAEEEALPPVDGGDDLSFISRCIAEATLRLQASEWRFAQIASNMRDIFWVSPTEKTEPVYVNSAYERIFGRPSARLLTHPWDWLKALAEEDVRPVLRMLQKLRQAPSEMEIVIRVHAGEKTEWLRCRGFSSLRHARATGALQVAGTASVITEEKEMEKRLIESAENERRRMGQDLHDDICQRLAAAQLKSGVLGRSLARDGHVQAALAQSVANELAEASEIARGYARGLAPVAVGAQDLPAALEDLRKFLERAFGISCRVSCEDVTDVVDREVAAQLYRITQELATNAAKHGRASWIAISLMHNHDFLRLEVANDGLSFDPEAGAKKKGMGLHMLRQRADALGAALFFQPRQVAEGGTLAVCELPLAKI